MTVFAANAMSTLVDVPLRYDLAESTCPPLTVGELAGAEELTGIALGYGTSQGDVGLRSLVAAGAGVAPDQVLVTVGAIEAMFLVAQATCGPGARVVLTTPCFPPARTVPEALGAEVAAVPASFEDGYRLPLDRLANALTPSTRLISLASPQNPAGVCLAEHDLHELLGLVAERAPEALVLVDETYREATYGAGPAPASYASSSPRVLTCSSLSKAHGAPGLRVGWLTTTDAGLYEQLKEAKFATTIGGSAVDELLAGRVLERREQILAPRAQRLREALDELLAWVDDQPLEVVAPDGGAMCCLRLPPERFSDQQVAAFYRGLADRETRVARGSWFGEHDRVFRLGFGHLEPTEFTVALDRVAEALADLR